MARPERKTVDYFPHFISDGKKMFFIEHKYGNNGYSTWFKILESLAVTEDHFLNLNNESDLMYLSAKCRVDENMLLDILNDLSKLGEISPELWNKKIVWSTKFTESIEDAYSRRNNKCMTFDSLCKHLLSLRITITPLNNNKNDINTQSKVKKSKVNQSKLLSTEVEVIDFDILLETFNKIFGRNVRVFNDEVQKKYKNLLNKGYTKTNIHTAMLNCRKDKFCIEVNWTHCTLEYFSRPKTIDIYGTELIPEPKGIIGTYTIHDHD